MKYRVTTFKTFTGSQEFVDLGDHAYGEWIVYENQFPKYHVSCFRENSISDSMIKELIQNHSWTIGKLLNRINEFEGKKLGLGKRPLIEIEKSSELRELDLNPLPTEWIEKLKQQQIKPS